MFTSNKAEDMTRRARRAAEGFPRLLLRGGRGGRHRSPGILGNKTTIHVQMRFKHSQKYEFLKMPLIDI